MPTTPTSPQRAATFHDNEHVPVPDEWGNIIGDPRLVAAIIDRLTFHAHIIETGTDSYRLRSTRTNRRRKP